MSACEDCLQRAWLLGHLAGQIEYARDRRGAVARLLALDSGDLIEAVGADRRREFAARDAAFDVVAARTAVAAAHLESRCRHESGFPPRLLDLDDAPSALFVAGSVGALEALTEEDHEGPAVAVVGARRCAGEGPEVARALGHDLAAAGVCVVSGLALGIDGAAHAGALTAPRHAPLRGVAPTVAVLAGGADVIYPRSARTLYEGVRETGCVISEMPPGVTPRKWMFPARNRIIAALAGMTVVVQARQRSGSLITAELAMQLGRPVGAVPGPVTSALSQGANALLHDGAYVVRDARDVLDALLPSGRLPDRPVAPALDPDLAIVLEAVDGGRGTPGEIAALGVQGAA
ncbi:MAG: DNA-protecting protein DprA, partial [Solirubrobacteraceae bacterium]|nr:DNA-protecting protein DprA [Solirubrobacteraceae bacterium]